MLRDVIEFFYKPGTKELHKEKLILSVSLLIFLVIFGIYGSKKNKEKTQERNSNARYTIGTTINTYKNIRSSYATIKYRFTVNLSKIVEFEKIPHDLNGKIKVQEGRYYVQFSKLNPRNCQLLLEYPVPDSIKNFPQEGWDFIPGYKLSQPDN